MKCANCEAEIPENAKFCPECGTAVSAPEAETAVVEVVVAPEPHPEPASEPDPTPVSEPAPEPEPVADITPDPEPEVAPKPVAEPSPAMPAAAAASTDPSPTPAPTPATPQHSSEPNRLSEERAALSSFVDAVLPVLKLPAVVFAAVAALATLVISLVASTLVFTVLTLISDLDLPDDAGDWWDQTWLAHFSYHQIPGVSDEALYALSPLLMVVVPLASALAGVFIARAITPGDFSSDRSGRWPWLPVTLYAVFYVIANLILSAFGADDAGVAFLSAVFMSAVIAIVGYTVAARLAKAPPVPNAPATPSFLRRAWHVAAIPLTTLAGMIIIASVLTFVANVIEISTDENDEGTRYGIVNSFESSLDNGWATVAYGMFGNSRASQTVGGDEDDEETTTAHIWDMHRDDDEEFSIYDGSTAGIPYGAPDYGTLSFVIVLITAFGTVLLGGLYAGFRLVRSAGPNRGVRDSALTGAMVGPVWAVATIFLSWLVTTRVRPRDEDFVFSVTAVEGVTIFFLALLVGAVLGAVGGLLASRSTTQTSPGVPVTPAQT